MVCEGGFKVLSRRVRVAGLVAAVTSLSLVAKTRVNILRIVPFKKEIKIKERSNSKTKLCFTNERGSNNCRIV